MKKFDQMSRHNKELKQAKLLLKSIDKESPLYSYLVSGLVSKFAIQFDLSWKILKKLMEDIEGVSAARTGSPRTIIKEAYKVYDFIDEEVWLKMLKSRNDFIHMYEEDLSDALWVIIDLYIPEFIHLEQAIKNQYGNQLNEIH